jgi:hypothetical protein
MNEFSDCQSRFRPLSFPLRDRTASDIALEIGGIPLLLGTSMKFVLSCVALFVCHLPCSKCEDTVRLLPPHASSIPATAGGEMVELLQAPSIVRLPLSPPEVDQTGNAWYVDVKNLGPNDVTLEETTPSAGTSPRFVLLLHPKDVARIRAARSGYVLVKRY